jgi:hypothetical protein
MSPTEVLPDPNRPETAQAAHFAVRSLLRGANRAALGTTIAADRGHGRCYVSLVAVATDFDASPLLLLSSLSEHSRNIEGDPRVSLLFDGTAPFVNPQQGPRVTVQGQVERSSDRSLLRRFLARHPAARPYASFLDFAIFRVRVEQAHWINGFAQATWLDGQFICPQQRTAEFRAAESDLVAGVETTGLATQLANRVLRMRGKGWRMIGVDCDGCDLAHGDKVVRLAFTKPLEQPLDLVEHLHDRLRHATMRPRWQGG